ncbi:MAG: FAD-binding oxidoreductase [Rhizobiaceae bacterium]|nr:FAD-binding oxidoreductase [Rhizobiaceae bacterium]
MPKSRLFDDSLYQFDEPQPSWWEASIDGNRENIGCELNADVACDVAIIGGGYTGLSAAYHLAKDFQVDVHVYEAGHIGWGASGRNGGFCCMGGTKLETRELIKKFGLEETRKYYSAQMEAVDLVRTIADDEAIDFEAQGDCEWVVAEKPSHFKALEEECEFKVTKLGLPSRMVSKEAFAEIGYDAPHQHGAFAEAPGFGLHPLKYCLGLAQAAERHGAHLHPHSEITSWEKQDDLHVMRTARGNTIRSKRVIVAGNGFMPEHLHTSLRSRALPLQSQIIVTRVLSDDEIAAHNWVTQSPAVNSRNVYFYYRTLPSKRFLIGGRADFKGTELGAKVTAETLRQSMVQLWPEWQNVSIEYAWRGFVCFTADFRPAVGRMEDDPSVYFGFGYHGNGVNNATWIGRELARWLATGNDSKNPIPTHLPTIVHGMTSKIPFGSLRPYYAKAGVGWHRFKDWIDGV